ncbi:MAG: hypothetical protein AB7I50_09655 [Vicinamibacterales bacterium]
MKNRFVLVAVAVVVLAGAWWYWSGGASGPAAVPLVDHFAQAEKRSSIAVEQAIRLEDVTIGSETRSAIFMHPTSRLTFKAITIPRDAWLRVWVALKPDVWSRPEGNGVLFRFGVSDGRTYDELARQSVDPQHKEGDRRWIPIEVDLSPYADLSVDLIFNTNSGLPGQGDDAANDWAVWGSPEIVVQR